MESRRVAFVKALDDWQAAAGLTQRQLAAQVGFHESRLSQLRTDGTFASPEFMRQAIARAPEPWKSVLKQARLADLEAADAAAIGAA